MRNCLFIHRLFIATAALTGFTVCLSEMTLASPLYEAEIVSIEVESDCKSTPTDEQVPHSNAFVVAPGVIVRGGTLIACILHPQQPPELPQQRGTAISRGPPVA
ncbi:MAG: hypothetical protein WAO83_12735 [Fuerstiella sp.]